LGRDAGQLTDDASLHARAGSTVAVKLR